MLTPGVPGMSSNTIGNDRTETKSQSKVTLLNDLGFNIARAQHIISKGIVTLKVSAEKQRAIIQQKSLQIKIIYQNLALGLI